MLVPTYLGGCIYPYEPIRYPALGNQHLQVTETEATTPWQLLVPRPAKCTPASAAALPTVYTTVDVAFAELAKLKKGEKATCFFFLVQKFIYSR